jgi:hypothetical protein
MRPALRAFLLILLVACSAAPPRLAQDQTALPPGSSTVIYVIKRKWHIDIGFAAADLQPPLAALRADFPAAEYVLFGFGDRHYLLAQDRGFGGMLAALRPGPGLMLITGLKSTLQAAFGADNVIVIPVSAEQARDAQAFIWHGLSAPNGTIAPLLAGPYEGSLYYSSSVGYSAWHTCNTWAAETLRAASLPVHSFGVELSPQLWVQVLRLGHRQSTDPSGSDALPGRATPPP